MKALLDPRYYLIFSKVVRAIPDLPIVSKMVLLSIGTRPASFRDGVLLRYQALCAENSLSRSSVHRSIRQLRTANLISYERTDRGGIVKLSPIHLMDSSSGPLLLKRKFMQLTYQPGPNVAIPDSL